jgi:hypothetical protein
MPSRQRGDLADRRDRAREVVDEKPVRPGRMISGIDPSG